LRRATGDRPDGADRADGGDRGHETRANHPTCRVSRAERCGIRPPSASTRSST
jgi:hypothetical protein